MFLSSMNLGLGIPASKRCFLDFSLSWKINVPRWLRLVGGMVRCGSGGGIGEWGFLLGRRKFFRPSKTQWLVLVLPGWRMMCGCGWLQIQRYSW